MARCRGCSFQTGVVAPVPTCPAVVPSIVVAGGGRYNAALAVQIGDHVLKFGVFLEGHNKFCMGCRNFGGEGAVCRSESRGRSAINSHSGGEVGDGVHRLLLVKVIIRLVFVLIKVIIPLEPGAVSIDLQFAPFLVISRKEGLNVAHVFLAAGRRFQVFQSPRKRPVWKTILK